MKGVKTNMFFLKRYSELRDEVMYKHNMICKSGDRAYQYYSEKFKMVYKKQSVKGEELYLYTNTSYDLDQTQYIFYDFDTLDIGKPVALYETDYLLIDGVRINYCDFQNCNIKNIIFRSCSFSGSAFINVNFEQVIFDSCIFSVPVTEDGKKAVNDTYYAPAIFKDCIFVGKFLGCDIENTLFEKVCFTLTKFESSSLQESIFNMCALSSVDFKDCNLSNFGICNTDILDLSFSDEHKSIVNENTFIDYRINTKKERNKEEITTVSGWKLNSFDDMCLKKAKSIKATSRIYELNNLSDFSGEYFYQSKLVEHKALHKLPKLISTLELVLCGYGERPLFTIITIIATTFLLGLVYMFTGINADGYSINYTIIKGSPVEFFEAVADYGQCLYFSIITGTIGYGNYDPVGVLSKVISSLHMIMGISLFTLWTGCIFRKIAR
ncbi:MAG: pentapeptide repeat-containing protein [Sedimentibacter saalensis]|uniref:pentapeptide repeat-containing protein n=1 Tax=Sedimentibacter saalensis TaxID=130788 RepID=UPI0031597F73